ncbi:MAG: hypothetical protein WDA24_05870 [Tissierellales bacterium]
MKKKILALILTLTILTGIGNIAFGEVHPPPIREESLINTPLPLPLPLPY